MEKQVKVDKVYLETTRNHVLATDAAVETMKKFFQDRGIKVSGGMGLTVQESNGFQSYCYSTPAEREQVKAMAEFTARHFDEIILDDFYFTNCKCDRCIAAKGDKSWTQFRTEQMDEVSQNLIVGPAKAVNPKVPGHHQVSQLVRELPGPGLRPGRRAEALRRHLHRHGDPRRRFRPAPAVLSELPADAVFQQHQARRQPGRLDRRRRRRPLRRAVLGHVLRQVPRDHALQLPADHGRHCGAADQQTDGVLANLMAPIPQPDGSTFTPNMVARTAGYSAELLDRFLGKLGKPIGVATYKPCNSVGEEYLPDYLGMIGVPIDLVPEFPHNAKTVLLTAASRLRQGPRGQDEEVRAGRRPGHRHHGPDRGPGRQGLSGHRRDRGHRPPRHRQAFSAAGAAVAARATRRRADEADLNIVMPQMRHFENDHLDARSTSPPPPPAIRWPSRPSYGQGTFYVLAIPDDFADLYRLPQGVLNQIRGLLGSDVFVSLDALDHVSLFAYDNRTFIVQNFRSQAVNTRVSVARSTHLHDLLSGKTILPTIDETSGGRRRRLRWRHRNRPHLIRGGVAGALVSRLSNTPLNDLSMKHLSVLVCVLCCCLTAHAELSLKEIRTASNTVLVPYFKSTSINANEVSTADLSAWKLNGQPVAAINKFITEADACDHHIYLHVASWSTARPILSRRRTAK